MSTPATEDDATGTSRSTLHDAAAAVRARVDAGLRRLRLQTAVQRLLWSAPVWLVLFAAWLGLVRSDVLPEPSDAPSQILLVVAAVLALGWAIWLRLTRLQVARQLDDAAGSADALSTALWLAETGRNDGWAVVQAERAAATARELQPAALLPWPKLQPWLLPGALALLALALQAPLPHRWSQGGVGRAIDVRWPEGPQRFASAADILGKEGTELLAVDLELLEEVLPQVNDPATKAWLTDVARLMEDVQQGRIDKQEALQKLAELEAARPGADAAATPAAEADPTGTAPTDPQEAERQRDVAVKNAIAEAAKEAVKAAPKTAEAEAIKKAAETGDLDKIAEAVEKLAGKNMSDAELEKWVKALEKFADKLGDRKVPEKFKALAERIAKLQEKRNKDGGLSPSDQRRLQEARKELQQLRKEQGDPESAKYQVQRLEKQVRHAADELRRSQEEQQQRLGKGAGKQGENGGQNGDGAGNKTGGQGGASQQEVREAMRQAADELRREAEGQKSRQAQRVGQSRLRDLREGLSRGQRNAGKSGGQKGGKDGEKSEAGQGSQGGQQGDSGEQGEAGEDGNDQRGRNSGTRVGKQGEGEGDGSEQGQEQRGGGQSQRKGFRLGSGNLTDKSRTEAIREGYGQKRSASGSGEGGGGEPGSGKGGENNGKPSGSQTGRDEKVRGQEGEGADIKQVFLDSAKKGFSRQEYKRVYGEYSEVAEEMTDKQQLPAGRKRLVRRYFEQIRPRDTGKPLGKTSGKP